MTERHIPTEGASQRANEDQVLHRLVVEGIGSVMNNFSHRLAAEPTKQVDFSNTRQLEEMRLKIDTTYGKQLQKDISIYLEPHSAVYLGLTPRKFWQRVDDAFADFGISVEQQKWLRTKSKQPRNNDVNLILFPVFMHLIRQGFNVRDLSE